MLASADGIAFGCPTYMGSVSAKMKAFMEHSSGAWYGAAWKNKVAAGFTNSASWSGDKLNVSREPVHLRHAAPDDLGPGST